MFFHAVRMKVNGIQRSAYVFFIRRKIHDGSWLRVLAINDCYKLDHLSRLRSCMNYRTDELTKLADNVGIKNCKVIRTLAGDFLSPNSLSPVDAGKSYMKCFNTLGITHFCFGNHEANLRTEQLEERIKECNGIMLNSNIPTFNRPVLPRFDIIQVGPGIRIGIIGLITNEVVVFRDRKFKGHVIDDVVDTTSKLITELKGKHACTHVIALSHQPIECDRILAQKTSLTAIIGGHDHVPFEEVINSTRIVKSGTNAEGCGILDILKMPGSDKLEIRYFLDPVTKFSENQEMSSIISSCESLVNQFQTEVLLRNGRFMSALGTRYRQTDFGSLVCDYMKAETGADLAMVNGASIKAGRDLSNGDLTFADLREALPFPMKIITIEMPGKVIQDAIIYSRNHPSEWDKEKRGFLQLDSDVKIENETISGKYGPKPSNNNAKRDILSVINKSPFDPSKEYLVSLPRNLLAGFCEIEPLIRFGKENPERLPGGDSFIPILDLFMRRCAKEMWKMLGSFDDIDTNHDGKITRQELKNRVEQVFGSGPSEDLTDHLTGALDLDEDGSVSLEEFARLRPKALNDKK